MRVVPAPVTSQTVSAAERKLHALFQEVDLPGWTAVHSLNLARIPYQRWGEADFVIIGPQGLLVIEVKGGRVAQTGAGWEYTNRFGERNVDRRGPFKQAERALVGLRDWLGERLELKDTEALSAGYAVAFPDIDFWEQSPEWAAEMIGDRRALAGADAIAKWLKRASDFWQGRNSITEPLDPALVKQLIGLLRPEFELVPPLATRAQQAVDASDRLTAEQMNVLDMVEANDRLLVEGGAGTGKTFVAAELARRRAAEADTLVRVLVPRPNSLLPLSDRLPPEVDIDSDGAATARPPADFLIVDEAQDLMSDVGLDAIDRSVVGGLAGGRWAIFMDPNEQARLRGLFEASAFELVLDANPSRLRLPRNLRNTDEIVEMVQRTTHADIGVPGGGHGPEVDVDIIDVSRDFAGVCRARLRRLAREQVPASEISVITWLDPVAVVDAIDGDPYPAAVFDEGAAAQVGNAAVSVSSPYAFQGLEAVHAILGPVPSTADAIGNAELYVAMTRARASVRMVITEDVASALAEQARALQGVES